MSPAGAGGRRWCVVGGGMLGCTLALRLARAGEQVVLLEAAPELGGLASAWELDVDGREEPLRWDRHYHVTLQTDAATRRVLAELDLERELRWVRTGTGYFAGERLVPCSNVVDFLRLPGLGLVGKGRLGATILYGSRIRDGERMERVLVDDWLRRWSGRRVFDTFWQPLLRAKLGDNHRIASAAFIWATIQRLWRARRAGMKEDLFGYVPGGYARILHRFREVLEDAGVEVCTATPVHGVTRDDGAGEVVVDLADGTERRADEVVLTTAAPIAARLVPGLPGDERDRFEGVTYQGIVCASLVLDRPLSPYYLTYITDPACPFTAVVEMTAFVDPAELDGRTLVYLPIYVTTDDPLLDASDDEVLERCWPYLRRLHPHLRDEDLLGSRVSRVRHVLAVTTLRYSEHVPPVHTGVAGVHAVSSANVVHGTLNVDETVLLAERTARSLLEVPG